MKCYKDIKCYPYKVSSIESVIYLIKNALFIHIEMKSQLKLIRLCRNADWMRVRVRVRVRVRIIGLFSPLSECRLNCRGRHNLQESDASRGNEVQGTIQG